MQSLTTQSLTLDWSKNIHGEPCQSFNKRFDTCDRLAVLLAKSTMYSFVSSVYHIHNISDNNKVINDTTYLRDIGKDLLTEINDLFNSDIKMNDSRMYKYNVSKETILSYKDDILELSRFLIQIKAKPLYKYNLDTLRFFDYGQGSGFIKEYAKYVISHIANTNMEATVTLPFIFPIISRCGYSLTFRFNNALNGVCAYSNVEAPFTNALSVKFLADTNIADISTDEYLNILSGYNVCVVNDGIPPLLNCLSNVYKRSSIFKRLCDYVIKKSVVGNISELLNNNHTAKQLLLKFLSSKVNTTECEVGRVTTAILTTIEHQNLSGDTLTQLQYLLNGEIAKEDYVSGINQDGINNQPDNYWVAVEAKEDEEPTEDEPEEEEEGDPEEEPADDPNKESEDEDPDEPEEGDDDPDDGDGEDSDDGDDEGDEPEEKEEPKKRIPVKVPRNSFLLRMIPADANTLDDWTYRIEIDNLICQVLDNPPEDISDETRILLSDFRRYYIYSVSIQSVWEFVEELLEKVPKPNKPKDA